MKKVLLSLLISVFALGVYAQKGEKSIGLNLGYGSEIESVAIGAKFNYGLTDQIRLSPSFNYFLKKDGLSAYEFNADVHYLFEVAPKISAYPLAGLNYTSMKYSADIMGLSISTSDSELGLNLGGGLGYQFSDNITLGFELKYVVSDADQLVPTFNIMFKF